MSKPNHCDLCNKSFTSPANLERHKLSNKHVFLCNLNTTSHGGISDRVEENALELVAQDRPKPQGNTTEDVDMQDGDIKELEDEIIQVSYMH